MKVTARAKSTSVGESKSNGNLQVGVLFEITDPSQPEGSTITYYGTVTEKSLEYVYAALQVCGWKGDMLSDFDDLDDASKLLPNEVELIIEDEEYKGRMTPKVKFVNRIGGAKLKFEAGPQALKTKAAQFKAAIQAMQAGAMQATPRPAQPRKPARMQAEDDLPF